MGVDWYDGQGLHIAAWQGLEHQDEACDEPSEIGVMPIQDCRHSVHSVGQEMPHLLRLPGELTNRLQQNLMESLSDSTEQEACSPGCLYSKSAENKAQPTCNSHSG